MKGIVLLTVVLLMLAIVPALAQNQGPVSGYDARCIEIDDPFPWPTIEGHTGADVVDGVDTCIDWLTKWNEPNPDLGGHNVVRIVDGVGNDDGDIFSPDSQVTAGSTLPKQDITRAFVSNNNDYLYIAEERRANNGSSAYHLLFTQKEPYQDAKGVLWFDLEPKDIMISTCFPGGKISDKNLPSIEVWQVPYNVNPKPYVAADLWDKVIFPTLFGTDPVLAAVKAFSMNLVPTQIIPGAYDSHGNLLPDTGKYDETCFAEAAVSLLALGIDVCKDQAYVTVITRSACSLNSDLKDVAGPFLYKFGGPAVSLQDPVTDVCKGDVCITAKTTGQAPPFTYTWKVDGTEIVSPFPTIPGVTIKSITTSTDTSTSTLCMTFTDGKEHTVDLGVLDKNNCPSSDTKKITLPTQIDITVDAPDKADCKDYACIKATITGGTPPYSITWYDNDAVIKDKDGNPITTDNFCMTFSSSVLEHKIKAVVKDANNCTDDSTDTMKVYPLLEVTLDGKPVQECSADPSALKVKWTATAKGGDGNYQYAWTLDGKPIAGATGSTYEYAPTPDCSDHTICVTVTDGNKCTDDDCKVINQKLTTTITIPKAP